MTKRMLIDAAHAEETRVVVVDGNRIEELDFESQSRKQLRGNIYLAKVTRVEPSLQAAFVEYGGNRHGFLAFNEIHPDYYQIPIADREALMREEAEAEEEDRRTHSSRGRGRSAPAASARSESEVEGEHEEGEHDAEVGRRDEVTDDDDDVMEEELERRRRRLMRRYKIQEVIKRRQIMLVQVVKEERGNKGAALTTYLSLAGRYCVLMPNTARGGGISRKITNAPDRKRLKSAAQSLDVPHGMGLIIRTAGAARTKVEIKRDYEYLLRLWETIREATLKSIAPALIYEEEDLVKRAIRDMYDKDIEDILVEGEAGYREARDFMRMIMPSQAKKIIHYKDPIPLFVKHKVEDQLAQMHSPVVQLRSGGYLVINQTEALVAVDVNSGKATRERNIEATALKTNMEAAEEAARQLRLRDLAGLVVIDFIDMDESKNNRAVEKKLKDCLKDDRARIQMGRISSFGLMEISRQRRRTGVLEGTTHVCEHCQGSGRVRSIESSALGALRAIEIEMARGGPGAITLRLCPPVALYVLNEKRAYLTRLEQVQGLSVTIALDDSLGHADVGIDRTATHEGRPVPVEAHAPVEPEPAFVDEAEYEDEVAEAEEAEEAEGGRAPAAESESESDRGPRRGRRRRRRGGRRDEPGAERAPGAAPRAPLEAGEAGDDEEDGDEEDDGQPGSADGGYGAADRGPRRRRRRGRRGGRRTREEGGREADPYVWVDPHGGEAPVETTGEAGPAPGEDPYVWRDPLNPRGRNRPPVQAAPARAAQPAPEPAAVAPAPEADVYAWKEPGTEVPAPEAAAPAKRVRNRKPSAKALAAEAAAAEAAVAVEAPAPVEAPQPESEPAPTPAAKAPRTRKPSAKALAAEAAAAEAAATAAEPVPEPAPAPVLALAPSPAPRTPDPAEISAPPAAPKRGWWHRG
ncbi:MAG TPA: ribonuclease E/G [Caulobacteraceae bacterium]|nr:ribonuclease E/G [Caulobacteraceae bacterium]